MQWTCHQVAGWSSLGMETYICSSILVSALAYLARRSSEAAVAESPWWVEFHVVNPMHNPISVTLVTLFMDPLSKDKNAWKMILTVHEKRHAIYMIAELLLRWSSHLMNTYMTQNYLLILCLFWENDPHTPPDVFFTNSGIKLFPCLWTFNQTIPTACESVNNYTSDHFSFQTKCEVMFTVWSFAQRKDFPSLI